MSARKLIPNSNFTGLIGKKSSHLYCIPLVLRLWLRGVLLSSIFLRKTSKLEPQNCGKTKIPELSLSPRCMLDPSWTSCLSCVCLSSFWWTHSMPMRITLLVLFSPLEAKSLSHTSLQPFRPVCSVASMQYQSVLPNSGILYYRDIAKYILYRGVRDHENVISKFVLTFLC